jgi:hypothetical protein
MITRMKTGLTAGIFMCLMMAAPALAEDSLYKQVGGYDAVAAVTDAFLAKAGADKSLKRFFIGHSQSSLVKIRQLIVDFICEKSGGPCVYTGRSMVLPASRSPTRIGRPATSSSALFSTISRSKSRSRKSSWRSSARSRAIS